MTDVQDTHKPTIYIIDVTNRDGVQTSRLGLAKLQKTIINIMLNAYQAMPDGGTLTICTSAQDGNVLVKVTDTGHGISKEHLERVFEPFFSTKPVGKGTGLGLSVSYGIVQQHGGSLEVDSVEGEGTTFTIVLPSGQEGQPDSHNEKVSQ